MTMYGDISPIVGATLRFIAPVLDITKSPVNPDNLSVAFRCQGQPAIGPFTYTFPSGDPSSNVVYTGTVGSFYCDYTLPNPGVWTVQWHAFPLSGLDATGTDVIIEREVTLSASAV